MTDFNEGESVVRQHPESLHRGFSGRSSHFTTFTRVTGVPNRKVWSVVSLSVHIADSQYKSKNVAVEVGQVNRLLLRPGVQACAQNVICPPYHPTHTAKLLPQGHYRY